MFKRSRSFGLFASLICSLIPVSSYYSLIFSGCFPEKPVHNITRRMIVSGESPFAYDGKSVVAAHQSSDIGLWDHIIQQFDALAPS